MAWFFAQGSVIRRACWLRRLTQYATLSAALSVFLARALRTPATPADVPLLVPVFYWHLGMSWIGFVAVAAYLDYRGEKRRLSRKTLRGTREVSPEFFARTVRGEGLGIPYLVNPGFLGTILGQMPHKHYLRIGVKEEKRHLLLCGDTGMGKSALMHDFLCQLAWRPSEAAIVYDPALEFWECHARPEQGDVLLHPLFADCPYWDLADEVQNPLDAKALAKSFLPNKKEGQEDFWDQAPQRILAFLFERLAAENKGVSDLLDWLSDPGLIDDMVTGTELSPMIDAGAAPQRAGVLASLNMIAEALKLLPPDDGRPRFSFRRWEEARWSGEKRGWVFIGSRFPERDALKPLVSAWLDMAFSKLMVQTGGPTTWVFADELPTLQRLPKLKDALQEARKFHLCFVLGFQGRAQLEQLYQRDAETLMSAPETRLFLKTKERTAAEWCAGNIGIPEQERGTESLTTSAKDGRDSMNTASDRQTAYLVLPNEIQNLPERTGYLRYGPYVVKIHFGYREFSERHVFRVRKLKPDPVRQTPPMRENFRLVQGGFHRE